MNEDILTRDKNNALRLAMASVESLIVSQCRYADKLLKEPEKLEIEEAARVETVFRALNHLSITLQRLQSVSEEREEATPPAESRFVSSGFVEEYGVTPEEVYRHYGYDPAEIERPGMGVGFWPCEKALEMFTKQPEALQYLSDKKKIRVVFAYDPDFPVALHITEATLKCNED